MHKDRPQLSPTLRAAIRGLKEYLTDHESGPSWGPHDFGKVPRPWPHLDDTSPPADSALALAADLRDGTRRMDEVLARTLRRAEGSEHLSAFITLDAERFHEEARIAAGLIGNQPLAGVPIGHKDIIATAGVRTTGGSRSRAANIPEVDAHVVRRLRHAGLPSVGKTNTHELATGITGQVSASGAARNPWDLARVTGGSSSGSAAAVAAGVVAVATATDTGGSARIPASCCGVVGFKPTYGSVPAEGVIPFSWTLDHVGAMARHAIDLHALAPSLGIAPVGPAAAVRRPLRFALPEHLLASAAEPVARLVRGVADRLEQDGAVRVAPAWPEWFEHADGIAAAIFLREGAAVHAELLRNSPELLEPATRDLLESAAAVSMETYRQALGARAAAIAASDALFDEVDVVVSPALPVVAPRSDEQTVQLPDGEADVRAALTRYTRVWNVCGNPVVCTPCGLADGLPVGVQFIGPRGEDDGLLRVVANYESSRGEFKSPGVS